MPQVILPGRYDNQWSGSVVMLDDGQIATTNATGHFSVAGVAAGEHASITVDAHGYLPAVCNTPTITAPETTVLGVTLLSGDLNEDNLVDVSDATAIGVGFGQSGPELSADLNRDHTINIFDVILVSLNFGKGTQEWNCLAE